MAIHDTIVIGGSAGAIGPLRCLLAQLPKRFAAAVFVVHRSPESAARVLQEKAVLRRHLAECMSRHGAMFVAANYQSIIQDLEAANEELLSANE